MKKRLRLLLPMFCILLTGCGSKSAGTDMEIVKATIEIVSLLVTSNQYITATLDKSAKSRIVF